MEQEGWRRPREAAVFLQEHQLRVHLGNTFIPLVVSASGLLIVSPQLRRLSNALFSQKRRLRGGESKHAHRCVFETTSVVDYRDERFDRDGSGDIAWRAAAADVSGLGRGDGLDLAESKRS
jgi:hypothetical protein